MTMGRGEGEVVGEGNRGDEKVLDRYGVKKRNTGGQMVIRICKEDGNDFREHVL